MGKCIILQSDNSHAGGSHREPKCTKTLSGNKKHNFECFLSLHSPQTAKPFGSIKIKSQLLLDCQLVERLLRRDKTFHGRVHEKISPHSPAPLTQDVTILHYRLCPTWWPAHLGFNIVSPTTIPLPIHVQTVLNLEMCKIVRKYLIQPTFLSFCIKFIIISYKVMDHSFQNNLRSSNTSRNTYSFFRNI